MSPWVRCYANWLDGRSSPQENKAMRSFDAGLPCRRNANLRRWFSLFAGVLALTTLPRPASACKPVITFSAGGGFLGGGAGMPPLPRNAAFIHPVYEEDVPRDAIAFADDTTHGRVITGRLTKWIYGDSPASVSGFPRTFLIQADELLAPGATVVPRGQQDPPIQTVGEYVDEQPPTAPVIGNAQLHVETADNMCDIRASLAFDVTGAPTDDHAPSHQLAYAVYLGKSAIEASTAPRAFVVGRPEPPETRISILSFTKEPWKDRPTYVAVSAMDFAGNESARSNAIAIDGDDAGPSSCAIRRAGARASGAAIYALALALLAQMRRRKRNRSRGYIGHESPCP
jgi:hypothetical protein